MNITDNDTPRATDMAGGTHTPAACLRVRVLRVTAGSITVTDGDGRQLELCLTGATGDRTYLSHIVRAGMRLNLVCPSTEGCRADAEIVVVEPDCLIDVTAVASCFEPYGESPALFVLGRLRPRASAAAVMLGNFASQLLDEEVHGRQDEYAGSVRKFFRHNGLAMAACSDLTPDFHAEARRQRDNIAHAITHGLADTGCWRSDRAVVEPSFICEMLGLQGRMDLMQDDLKVLVEQKSGKAAWQPRPDGLKAHDKHRVQLMLYMAVLHYAFGIAYSEMHSYLLYSKYHDGLLRTDRPDGLLARAMRLRNAIAATELACAGEGAGQLLWEITPERLVTDTRGMAFMRRFAQPRIEALLRPLHEASLLERAYYLRMYRFVAAEHLLAKTGTTGCGKAGFASVWLTPAAEKIESGDMMASMTLDPVSKDEDGISRLTLRTADKGSADMTNFRTGDTVIAYPYPAGGRPDARRTFVYRATVEDIATDKVKLIALGNSDVPVGQYSEEIFKHMGVWDKLNSENKISFASNVKEVLAQTEAASVSCGVVYGTDAATSDKVDVVAGAPEGSHKPIVYPAAILKGTKHEAAAKAFVEYLKGPEATAVFERIGFAIPEK